MRERKNFQLDRKIDRAGTTCSICGKPIDTSIPESYDVVKTKRGNYITFHYKCYLDTCKK